MSESYRQWETWGAQLVPLDFAHCSTEEAEKVLHRCSIIYLEGGNPSYLAYALKESGCVPLIRAIVKAGNILCFGSSAGSMVIGKSLWPAWFAKGRFAPRRGEASYEGLGFVGEVIVPHPTRGQERVIKALRPFDRRLRPLRDGEIYAVGERSYSAVPRRLRGSRPSQ
ncbi:Type 1 glutamine amidotransferase-like domain-containing protein [Patescibacteria group bacterium]|nr:Type 1 glutamine amidotransferase-like domain-containing protein [Patescibacteria group bacterium]